MTPFAYFPTPQFSAKMEKIQKSDPPGYRRILQVIERLLIYPSDADGQMRGVHHGRLKKYVGRRDYRLIYEWCQICRKKSRRMAKQCNHCIKVPDHSVIFFDIYHKNELAHLKHI
ncbi:type II toxin-antitoxin system RelE family toxin [Syntrophotalea acetylenivorans]|uniref:type II toxin-antitoxin system RelE family toxin n=1 Tax=Syntrophotalea acetylenivorans TaxID=1842532 RepID=UPI000931E05D|nr:toxin [Syntrophotalea acetylenivorans]